MSDLIESLHGVSNKYVKNTYQKEISKIHIKKKYQKEISKRNIKKKYQKGEMMFYSVKNTLTKSLLIISLLLSANSFANTICALNCPASSGGSTGTPLPQILELYSTDDGDLFLDTAGLIILDTDVYNNLLGLTIDASTSVYFGLGALPVSLALPDVLELTTVTFTGVLSITGLANDYVLLRQFSNNSILDLTAANGILVMDTSLLSAVPLPSSIVFLLSGFALLLTRGFGREYLVKR